MGIIADRWINAEKLYSILHFLYAATLFYLPTVNDPQMFFLHYATGHVFLHADVSTIQFHFLHRTYFGKLRLSKILPPIRVWGTIGFIAAMWLVNLTGNKATGHQFNIAGGAALALSLFALSLPKCPPKKYGWRKQNTYGNFWLGGLQTFWQLQNGLVLRLLYVSGWRITIDQCLWRCFLG